MSETHIPPRQKAVEIKKLILIFHGNERINPKKITTGSFARMMINAIVAKDRAIPILSTEADSPSVKK